MSFFLPKMEFFFDEVIFLTKKSLHEHTFRAETIKNALEVMSVCSVFPKTQLAMCKSIPLPENVNTPAISIILGLAEGEIVSDPDVQKAALCVIINCVCGPGYRVSNQPFSRNKVLILKSRHVIENWKCSDLVCQYLL